ncbi:CHAT domain-containing protein [Mesorhizobium amorphae]|uniref:CHAT domain-containing protein n=1 Tax=Mesorhizobium amorphae TaxID=71433 RepID=UPI003ECCF79B
MAPDQDVRFAQAIATAFVREVVELSDRSGVPAAIERVLAANYMAIVFDQYADALHLIFSFAPGSAPALVVYRNNIHEPGVAGLPRAAYEDTVRKEGAELICGFTLGLAGIQASSEEEFRRRLTVAATQTFSKQNQSSPSTVLLYLAANPLQTTHLDLEKELRNLSETLRSARLRDRIKVVACHAARPQDLVAALRSERPSIVHFSGHGERQGIVFRDDRDQPTVANGESLARTFDGRGVQLLLLNSCYSEAQAAPVSGAVGVVVGTNAQVVDDAALRFSSSFYGALFDGHTVQESFKDATDAMALYQFEDVFRLTGSKEYSIK